jgi:hypothetical protein
MVDPHPMINFVRLLKRRPVGRTGGGFQPALVAALLLPLVAPSAALAQRSSRGIEVENMRVGFDASLSKLKAGNSFKIGTWTPVWIQLRGGSQPFNGIMELNVADDDGTPTAFHMPVEVGANLSQRFTAYARPGSRQPEFTIRLLSQDGRRVGGALQDTVMPQPPESIMPDETLILTFGRPQGVETIAELPGFKSSSTGRGAAPGAGVEIVTARVDPQSGSMPGRWYGYDGARAIVIDTSDRDTMAALDALRGRPLVDWVERGGHLVVAVGANWQAVRDSVLGPILPGLPSGQQKVASLEALDTFAGSNKSITPPGTPPVLVTKLEEIDQRGGRVLSVMSNLPLVVRGAHGFGRVTLIALDVDQKPFSDWVDRSLFWVRAIDLKRPRNEQSGTGANLGGGAQFYGYGASDLSSQLRVGLEQFPGVKLIPFGWVAFFIFLYILLIGPGDYFFLKKVLKRMELTWITFPTIVITVSLVAYYAAYLLKGNDLLVNKVDVVDIDQTTGLVRGNTWVSLFSPQNRDYTIRTIPLPLDHDPLPAAGSKSEPAKLPVGTEVVTSWFSAPENQFGAMGNSGRRFSFAGSGYSYQPTGGVESLENVRIPIWSTKCISSRWFGPTVPLIDSDLQPVGTDRLAGIITNRQSIPLDDAILAFGKQVYLLGTLAPGATVRVELTSDRNLSGLLKDRQRNFLSDQPWNRDRRIDRGDLMLTAMFHDSESTLTSERTLANNPLNGLDLTGQLALQRPMLVARIKRAGARLEMDNVPSAPKIDQLTLVRIILPLNKKAKA